MLIKRMIQFNLGKSILINFGLLPIHGEQLQGTAAAEIISNVGKLLSLLPQDT